MKRYRRPKVIEGQIKAQKGKVDGDVDFCIFYGDDIPRCDRTLVMNTFGSERYSHLHRTTEPSFIEELELRGYDLDTFQFSIKRKETPTNCP